VENFFNRLKTMPVIGALIAFADRRPRLTAWIVLSVGIVVLLLIEARDVGLLLGQWIALIVASVLVAGLCIWIVTWEDSEETAAVEGTTAATTATPTSTTTPAEEPK